MQEGLNQDHLMFFRVFCLIYNAIYNLFFYSHILQAALSILIP